MELFYFSKRPRSSLSWVLRRQAAVGVIRSVCYPSSLLRCSLLFPWLCLCGMPAGQAAVPGVPGDGCARWPSLSHPMDSHPSLPTVHPVTVAVCGSGGEAGNIMFELIRETRSDSSWNGQHLYTERARMCYTACINHEVGSRGIPVAARYWLTQLESCLGSFEVYDGRLWCLLANRAKQQLKESNSALGPAADLWLCLRTRLVKTIY